MDRSYHLLAHIRLSLPSFNLLRVSVTMLGQAFLEASGIFQIPPDSGTGQGSKQVLLEASFPARPAARGSPAHGTLAPTAQSSPTCKAPETPQEQRDKGGPQATPDRPWGEMFSPRGHW